MSDRAAPSLPQEHALEIIEDVYRCKIPIPNNPLRYVMSYLIKSANGCTIIDAGWDTPESLTAWDKQLKELRLKFEDIEQVIITHLHPDHYGLAGKIRDLSQAKIIMSAYEAGQLGSRYENYDNLVQQVAEFLTSHGVPPELVKQLQGASLPALDWVIKARPDEVVEDEDIIHTRPLKLRVMSTPGHSRGHICLYAERERLLFSGDHVLPTITPNISLNPQSSSNPLAGYLESFEKLKKMEVNLVLPAHEYAFSNLAERLREIENHHERRLNEVADCLTGEPATAYEIAPKISWDSGPWEGLGNWERRAAIMESLAHLEYLRSKGRIKRDDTGEFVRWSRI